MSFFQTLFNSYKPYNLEKNQPSDFRTNYIICAFNCCYPVVDNTPANSTMFRKQAATETMLFLIAYGINYIAKQLNYDEFKLKGSVWGISKLMSESVNEEISKSGVNEDFICCRIFNYLEVLNEWDEQVTLISIIVLLNEKPLYDNIRNKYDINNIVVTSNLAKNLGNILKLSALLQSAMGMMKEAMNKSYRI